MPESQGGGPPADGQPKIARQILDYLKLEGVGLVFGIPGGSIADLLDELRLDPDGFTYVITRHEAGAAYMADGYYRVTEKLGVCLVTSGPGGSNALTGSMNAHASNSATLLITGEVPQSHFGKGYLQEGIDGVIDIKAILRNATQYSAIVSAADNFHTLFRQALRQALGNPRRTTHISVPVNILRERPSDGSRVPAATTAYRAATPGSSPETVEAAFEKLTDAQWPMIYLGNGARYALKPERLARFQRFVEKFAIPVATTPAAKGVFPETHPMALRTFGMAQCEWPRRYMGGQGHHPNDRERAKYDCALIMGSSLRQWATSSWSPRLQPDGPLMQVDVDHKMLGRVYPMDLGITGDIGPVIDHLCALGEAKKAPTSTVYARRSAIQELKETVSPFDKPDRRAGDGPPLPPERAMAEVNETMPNGGHIFVDVGNCIGWAIHYLAVDPPTQIHSAQYMAPMGFAVCAVVGAKMGRPDLSHLCITGDGAFMMHGNEISTAKQYGVGAVWLVLYDDDLHMVSQGNATFFPAGDQEPDWFKHYRLGTPDLASFARGLGAATYEVTTASELRHALETAFAAADRDGQPQAIIATIDPHEEPPYWKAV